MTATPTPHATPSPAQLPELPTLPARELRRLMGNKQISPVELMQACITRIEAINPAVNAICATDFERAIAVARNAEAAVLRGDTLPLLHGLPIGIKDLQDTAGLLTTYGNAGLRNNVPALDNSLVARLRAAGAIVTAKTNVPDMGAGANTRNPVWGATGNPFNPLLNAGGSSGGSAAALACDLLPLCTGSDTGGSLRIPAALCGVVGLRPSPGLVGNRSRPLGWSSISVLGPMGRDVADTALLLAASVGLDRHDPLSYPAQASEFWPLPEVDLSTLRIGYTEDFGVCAVDPMIRRAFRARLAAIRPWVRALEPVDLQLTEADRAFDVLRAESFVAAFADTLRTAPETLGPNVQANVAMAASITLADRAWAHSEQTRIAKRFAQCFDPQGSEPWQPSSPDAAKHRDRHAFDLILAPTTPLSPFAWTELYARTIDGKTMANYYQWLGLTYVVTLATNPALALPAGLDEAGMPFGLQLIGPLRGDARLLAMAQALEQALELATDARSATDGGKSDVSLARPRPDPVVITTPTPSLRSLVQAAPDPALTRGNTTAPAGPACDTDPHANVSISTAQAAKSQSIGPQTAV